MNDEQSEELEEIVKDLSKENNKRERSTQNENFQSNNKIIKYKNNNTTLEGTDQSEEESDMESSHKELLNSTPANILNAAMTENKILSQSLTEEAAKNNEITHFFSVPDTPAIRHHFNPNKRNKKPNKTIPETPEIKSNKNESPAIQKDHNMSTTYKEDITQDNHLIAELVSDAKHNLIQHE